MMYKTGVHRWGAFFLIPWRFFGVLFSAFFLSLSLLICFIPAPSLKCASVLTLLDVVACFFLMRGGGEVVYERCEVGFVTLVSFFCLLGGYREVGSLL